VAPSTGPAATKTPNRGRRTREAVSWGEAKREVSSLGLAWLVERKELPDQGPEVTREPTREFDRGVEVAPFDGEGRLPGDADLLGQRLLGRLPCFDAESPELVLDAHGGLFGRLYIM